MCEFTVYLDGHEDENVVAQSVVKVILKNDSISMMSSNGEITKVPNAYITKVDSIMAELRLKTKG